MRIEQVDTFWLEILSAGDIATAKQVCREYTFAVGLCVTVEPVDFIYTGREERGFRVRLVNYPRFPATPDSIIEKGEKLAHLLMERCCQWSSLLVTPQRTRWFSRKPDAPGPIGGGSE